MATRYDLVVIGTGPAAAFFLHGYLAKAPASAKVLVLEKGQHRTHAWQLAQRGALLRESLRQVAFKARGKNDKKRWKFGVALGGTSNLWWACTPRLLPADFELKSRYGVGEDWPIGYADLERYYCEAESIMGVAGPSDDSPFERSKPYPHPPHAMTRPELLLKQAHPGKVFALPSARPTAQHGTRAPCCNSGICGLCPIDSKFTVLNQMAALFDDPRVTLRTGSPVRVIETRGGMADSVVFGEDERAEADLVALAAGAFFNPHILLRSDIQGGPVGKYLHEQVSMHANIYLDGVDNFQGSSAITGHGYQLYDGEHRSKYAAGLLEMWNVPSFRVEPGKWRQLLKLQLIYEDIPQAENRVEFRAETPDQPQVFFERRSKYATRALRRAKEDLERVFATLPVEKMSVSGPRDTEGHVLGTTRMGSDPASSVVDGDLRHHGVRNLLVLGGSTYPVSSPSNPTLTIAALSLRAAERL